MPPLAPPIGTERIRTRGPGNRWPTIEIKTINGWKPKHLMLAEIWLGRTPLPKERVCFKDGNRLNCTIDNIFVIPRGKIVQHCPGCGKILMRRERREHNRLCRKCFNEGLRIFNRHKIKRVQKFRDRVFKCAWCKKEKHQPADGRTRIFCSYQCSNLSLAQNRSMPIGTIRKRYCRKKGSQFYIKTKNGWKHLSCGKLGRSPTTVSNPRPNKRNKK